MVCNPSEERGGAGSSPIGALFAAFVRNICGLVSPGGMAGPTCH